MLEIAFELIGEATSNSLLMFCFCNLIIAIILTGSSKPGSMDSQDSTFTTSLSFNMSDITSDYHDDDEEAVIVDLVSSAQDEPLIDASGVSEREEETKSSHCCDDVGDGNENVEADYDDVEAEYDDVEAEYDDVEAEYDDVEAEYDDVKADSEDVEAEYADVKADSEDDKIKSREAGVEEEEGDDDLRKRVEEFIAKINNEWRHEKLRTLNLVY